MAGDLIAARAAYPYRWCEFEDADQLFTQNAIPELPGRRGVSVGALA